MDRDADTKCVPSRGVIYQPFYTFNFMMSKSNDYSAQRAARARRADAHRRTPDKFYVNIYDNASGELILSHGFHTEQLATSYLNFLNESVQRYTGDHAPLTTAKVEEAIAWDIRGNVFTSFADALLFMWEHFPGEVCIKGVFKK